MKYSAHSLISSPIGEACARYRGACNESRIRALTHFQAYETHTRSGKIFFAVVGKLRRKLERFQGFSGTRSYGPSFVQNTKSGVGGHADEIRRAQPVLVIQRAIPQAPFLIGKLEIVHIRDPLVEMRVMIVAGNLVH